MWGLSFLFYFIQWQCTLFRPNKCCIYMKQSTYKNNYPDKGLFHGIIIRNWYNIAQMISFNPSFWQYFTCEKRIVYFIKQIILKKNNINAWIHANSALKGLTIQPPNYSIWIFTHLTLCLADAIHNLKWVKIIQIWQNGGLLLSNLADWCHVLFSTCLKADGWCANRKSKKRWIQSVQAV